MWATPEASMAPVASWKENLEDKPNKQLLLPGGFTFSQKQNPQKLWETLMYELLLQSQSAIRQVPPSDYVSATLK